MSDNVKIIVSESPQRQCWKALRYFRDQDYAVDAIRSVHSVPAGEHVANLKKQATQVGYCIRQAEEYFSSARDVTLATRPTLLYYGLTSLSKALTLIRLDGTFSFDALRREGRHNHHGLELDRGSMSHLSECADLASTLRQIGCSIFRRQTSQGEIPWGHFALFYKSLRQATIPVEQKWHVRGNPGAITATVAYPCADLPSLEDIQSRALDCLSLSVTLPDLIDTVAQWGITPELSRANAELEDVYEYVAPADQTRRTQLVKRTFDFSVNGVATERKAATIKFLTEKNPKIKLVIDLEHNFHLRLVIEREGNPELKQGYLPDMVDNLLGEKFLIVEPTNYIPESAAMLALGFCFGMLSRYYPDLWMRLIDANVRFAEFTDALLEVLSQKFPRLMLDQLTGVRHSYRSTI